MKKEEKKIKTKPRQAFRKWYAETSFGHILQSIEASYLQSNINFTYNHKFIQVGHSGAEGYYIDQDFLSNFAIIDDEPIISNVVSARIMAETGDLPIASESIDTLILYHVIEFENGAGEADRHQLLREAERVLKPEGQLFILCLNPFSIHGALSYLPRSESFWQSRFVTSHRLLDWLSLLKFEAEYSAAFSITSCNSITRPTDFWDRARAEVSFAYAIKGIKRTYNLLPLERSWLSIPSLASGALMDNAQTNQIIINPSETRK